MKLRDFFSKIKKISKKLLALCSYLGILVFVPLIVSYQKKDEFIISHTKQGLAIFFLEIVCLFIIPIPVIGLFLGLIGYLLCLIFSVWGIIKVLLGKSPYLPFISKLSDRFDFLNI